MKNKRVKEWDRERAKLKKIYYEEKGITTCEVCLKGCMRGFALSFAHKHKRVWYYTNSGLGDFNETLLTCAYCHSELEKDKELTKAMFNKLR